MDGLVASAHLFRFRSLGDAVRSLAGDRHRLAGVEGLRFSRHVFVGALGTEGFTIGVVDPRRQLALCMSDGEHALDRFLEESPIGRSWRECTDEYASCA